MKKSYVRLALVLSSLLLLLFVLFVINQTAQIVNLASRIDPIFGTAVLFVLLAVYAVVIVVPLTIFLRLPAPLRTPSSEDSVSFPLYLEALKKRLSTNKHLKGQELTERKDIEAALAVLHREADNIIKATASQVFITTAISQNGRLDALLVLSAASRMVWQIAHLFYQRPTPGEMLYLYANVGATVFLVSELDDIDVHEQLEPILVGSFGSAVSAVPGTSLLVNSLLTAAGNTLLTLRVGAITKRYCGSLCLADRRSIRRSATVEALRMSGRIIQQCTATVSKAAWVVSKKKMGETLTEAGTRIRESGRKFFGGGGTAKPKTCEGDTEQITNDKPAPPESPHESI